MKKWKKGDFSEKAMNCYEKRLYIDFFIHTNMNYNKVR